MAIIDSIFDDDHLYRQLAKRFHEVREFFQDVDAQPAAEIDGDADMADSDDDAEEEFDSDDGLIAEFEFEEDSDEDDEDDEGSFASEEKRVWTPELDDWLTVLEIDYLPFSVTEWLRPVFHEAQCRAPGPHPVTVEEMVDDFIRDVLQWYRIQSLEFAELFEVFKESVRRRIRRRVSDPIKCCTFLSSIRRSVPFGVLEPGSEVLWSRASGDSGQDSNPCWTVYESGVLPASGSWIAGSRSSESNFSDVFVTVEGACSSGAIARVVLDLRGILRAIYECHHQIWGGRYRNQWRAYREPDGTIAYARPPWSTLRDENRDRSFRELTEKSGETSGAIEELKRHRAVFYRHAKEILDAVLCPNPKDQMKLRLSNAVKLIAKALDESDNGLSLALNMGAMEAMFSQKSSSVSQIFTDVLAKVLEPIPEHRSAAVTYISKLYSLRSDVLHGAGNEVGNNIRFECQYLAFAALTSFIERRMFLIRIGAGPEKPEDLLREIKNERFTDGSIDGVEESQVFNLWRPGEDWRRSML